MSDFKSQEDFIKGILESIAVEVSGGDNLGPEEVRRFFESRPWKNIIDSAKQSLYASYRITADPVTYSEDERKVAGGRIAGIEWLLQTEEALKRKVAEATTKGEL